MKQFQYDNLCKYYIVIDLMKSCVEEYEPKILGLFYGKLNALFFKSSYEREYNAELLIMRLDKYIMEMMGDE